MIIAFANYSWMENGFQCRIDPTDFFGVYPDKCMDLDEKKNQVYLGDWCLRLSTKGDCWAQAELCALLSTILV